MMLIPDGIFSGDRPKRCSRGARLALPHLLMATNGFGVIELNPRRIIGRAFADYEPAVTEQEAIIWLNEYVSNQLLFPFETGGRLWGAWDLPEGVNCLPRYKTSADRREPLPPENEFQNWRKAYRTSKTRSSKPVANILEKFSNSSQKLTETLPKHSGEIAEQFPRGVGVGVGVGDGVGDGVGGEGVGVGAGVGDGTGEGEKICTSPVGEVPPGSIVTEAMEGQRKLDLARHSIASHKRPMRSSEDVSKVAKFQ